MHMCGSGIKQWLMQSLYTKYGALILWVSPFLDSFSPQLLVVEWLWLTRTVSSGKFSMSFSQPATYQLQPVLWLKAVKIEN